MPSRICCPNNHSSRSVSIHEATIALSEGREIGVCKKCGKELQYRFDYVYTHDPKRKKYSFVVTRVARLGARLAEGENYEPLLLALRDSKTSREQVLPTFWAQGKSTMERGGQFPPLVTLEEWKTLIRQLDTSSEKLEQRIRVRAYQLYEQRGKTDGYALHDWLQAEAELSERKAVSTEA
jgi:hypothetical protein